MSLTLRSAARSRVGKVFATVTAARLVEQGLLGLAMLLLAGRLGVRDFAPVSALFIVNSVAVALSDFGLGYAVLRLAPGTGIARSDLTRLRLANASLCAVGVVIAFAVRGDAGVLIAGGSVIWALSAESYVRKAAATREDRVGQAARAECIASVIFFAVVAAAASGGSAVVVTAMALALKHAIEVVLVTAWRDAFSADGVRARPGWIWITQSLAFAISNVDFLIVRLLCGAEAFSIYSLAFRVTSAPHAQLSAAIMRSSLLHLSTTASLQRSYDRFVRPLFAGGAALAAVIAAGAVLAPVVLGEAWKPVVGVIVVLSIGLPWRMVMSLAGTLAMRQGALRQLAWWELVRFIASTVVLAAAAAFGFAAFVGAVTVVAVVSAVALHRAAGRATNVSPWGKLAPVGFVACLASVVVSASLVG